MKKVLKRFSLKGFKGPKVIHIQELATYWGPHLHIIGVMWYILRHIICRGIAIIQENHLTPEVLSLIAWMKSTGLGASKIFVVSGDHDTIIAAICHDKLILDKITTYLEKGWKIQFFDPREKRCGDALNELDLIKLLMGRLGYNQRWESFWDNYIIGTRPGTADKLNDKQYQREIGQNTSDWPGAYMFVPHDIIPASEIGAIKAKIKSMLGTKNQKLGNGQVLVRFTDFASGEGTKIVKDQRQIQEALDMITAMSADSSGYVLIEECVDHIPVSSLVRIECDGTVTVLGHSVQLQEGTQHAGNIMTHGLNHLPDLPPDAFKRMHQKSLFSGMLLAEHGARGLLSVDYLYLPTHDIFVITEFNVRVSATYYLHELIEQIAEQHDQAFSAVMRNDLSFSGTVEDLEQILVELFYNPATGYGFIPYVFLPNCGKLMGVALAASHDAARHIMNRCSEKIAQAKKSAVA